jgi:hypothetical protein
MRLTLRVVLHSRAVPVWRVRELVVARPSSFVTNFYLVLDQVDCYNTPR